MIKLWSLFFIVCSVVFWAWMPGIAADQDETVIKRPETTVTLDFGEQGKADVSFPSVPYVNRDGIISILPGETIFVEFDVVNGQLANPQYVQEVRNKGKTLQLSMTQDKKHTMLKISNGFSQTVVSDCSMQLYGEDRFRKTNVLPIEPGLTNYESWENRVCHLLLQNVRFQKR